MKKTKRKKTVSKAKPKMARGKRKGKKMNADTPKVGQQTPPTSPTVEGDKFETGYDIYAGLPTYRDPVTNEEARFEREQAYINSLRREAGTAIEAGRPDEVARIKGQISKAKKHFGL